LRCLFGSRWVRGIRGLFYLWLILDSPSKRVFFFLWWYFWKILVCWECTFLISCSSIYLFLYIFLRDCWVMVKCTSCTFCFTGYSPVLFFIIIDKIITYDWEVNGRQVARYAFFNSKSNSLKYNINSSRRHNIVIQFSCTFIFFILIHNTFIIKKKFELSILPIQTYKIVVELVEFDQTQYSNLFTIFTGKKK
jgi:hypothetical protein